MVIPLTSLVSLLPLTSLVVPVCAFSWRYRYINCFYLSFSFFQLCRFLQGPKLSTLISRRSDVCTRPVLPDLLADCSRDSGRVSPGEARAGRLIDTRSASSPIARGRSPGAATAAVAAAAGAEPASAEAATARPSSTPTAPTPTPTAAAANNAATAVPAVEGSSIRRATSAPTAPAATDAAAVTENGGFDRLSPLRGDTNGHDDADDIGGGRPKAFTNATASSTSSSKSGTGAKPAPKTRAFWGLGGGRSASRRSFGGAGSPAGDRDFDQGGGKGGRGRDTVPLDAAAAGEGASQRLSGASSLPREMSHWELG